MFRFPDHFWYRPSQSLEVFIPIFITIGILILLVWALNTVYRYISVYRKKTELWRLFYASALRKGLGKREAVFLLRILREWKIASPIKILRKESEYKKLISHFESTLNKEQIQMMHVIRQKLFPVPTPPRRRLTSTLNLPIGTKLHIVNPLHKHLGFDGIIIDQDPQGMVVSVPSEDLAVLPLKNGCLLSITSEYDTQPIHFFSTVDTFIPGGRRTAILTHSDHISHNQKQTILRPFTHRLLKHPSSHPSLPFAHN